MAIYEEEREVEPIPPSFRRDEDFYNFVKVKCVVSDMLEILLRCRKDFIVWDQNYDHTEIILAAFEDRNRVCIDPPIIFRVNSSHLKDFNERCEQFGMVLIHKMLLDDPSMRTYLNERVFRKE